MKKAFIVLLVIVMVFAICACSEKAEKDRVYGSEATGVTLKTDGTFTAVLYHGFSVSGTYTETTKDGLTTVTFTVDGEEFIGTINKDVLIAPHEWEDDHGHGNAFMLQK